MKNMRHEVIHLLSAALMATSLLAQSPERHPLYEPAVPSAGSGGNEEPAGNLFKGATVTASGSFGKDLPELAVDGRTGDVDKYWGCERLPVWLQIDMGSPRPLSELRVWPYWSGGRVYQYKIEGSVDGKKWTMLADQTANTIPATRDGMPFRFEPETVRYVKITFTGNSAGKEKGGHLVEIKGYGPDSSLALKAAAVSDYVRVSRQGEPKKEELRPTLELGGWRGERAAGQIAVWSAQAQPGLAVSCAGLRNAAGQIVPAQVSMVRYTRAGGALIADIIGRETRCDLQGGTVRPVWVEIDIPPSAKPGVYKGKIAVSSENGQTAGVPVALTVEPDLLPAPANWKVHLDLWQHPEAVARWHDVEPWSPEHFLLMKPVMKRLAAAGQKAITCSLMDEPWNGQTYDWWPSMIRWIKGRNGKMRYDYTNFDKWVSFMMNEIGIREQISCYTMVPWNMRIRYFDEATGSYKFLEFKHEDPSYEAVWGPFLTDFRKHVKSKGWLGKTCIALDERSDALLRAARDIVRKYAPEFKFVSAVNAPTAMAQDVYDVSPIIGHAGSMLGGLPEKRRAEGKKTTFYVCVSPRTPNTFTHSPLAEAEWLGLFAAANRLDGFLRWAYNSWNRNPFEKTDFGNFPPGDCFLVYPGGLSSLRFEKLRDGLEELEKVNILRSRASKSAHAKAAVERMDTELARLFTVERSKGTTHRDDVLRAREIIRKTAEAVR